MIPTTSKSGYIYDKIFKDIKEILIDNKISLKKIPNNIMLDFEKPLIKSLISKFGNTTINGCYYLFIKLLWNKAKSFNLCKKEKFKNTKIRIFILKILPFLKIDDRDTLFGKLEVYIKILF